jgi:homoisocitrate dehydrogenase
VAGLTDSEAVTNVGTGDETQAANKGSSTVAHKSNVLSQTDGLFRETARRALSAEKFSSVFVEEHGRAHR